MHENAALYTDPLTSITKTELLEDMFMGSIEDPDF